MTDNNSFANALSHHPTLAILGFHKIGEPAPGGWETWFYIPEAIFVNQLTYLHTNGWEVIDLATFLKGLVEPESLPDRAALLTFDDGYRSMRHVVLPWLRRFGDPGVLFVPTDFIGGSNTFDTDVEPEEPICDWNDLYELAHQGVSIQSHGVAHRALSEITLSEQEDEVVRSKAILEAKLGQAVEVFSYPYGDAGVDPESTRRLLQRAGYRAACLYGGGPNQAPFAHPYRLERLAMGPDTDLQAELEKVVGGHHE